MPPFMYRCPSMGCRRVQGFLAKEASEANADDYLTVLCTECQQIHLINPATGEVLPEEEETKPPKFWIEVVTPLN
jgi:hypothetical protein